MTVADIFIKKEASVSHLANFVDRMEAAFGGCADVKILCYARIISVTIDAGVFISDREIREEAEELEWIINDIVRRV